MRVQCDQGNCQLAKKIVLLKKLSQVTIFDELFSFLLCIFHSLLSSSNRLVYVSFQMAELHLAHRHMPVLVFLVSILSRQDRPFWRVQRITVHIPLKITWCTFWIRVASIHEKVHDKIYVYMHVLCVCLMKSMIPLVHSSCLLSC